jgi:hypothetical protein
MTIATRVNGAVGHIGRVNGRDTRDRSRLVKRGLLFDSPAMVIGFEAAIVALGVNELERRQTISGISAVEVLAYREQVAVAESADKPALS